MTKPFQISLALVVLLSAFAGSTQESPALAQGANDNDNSLNLVVAVQGHARVKRKGWSDYAPALLGTPLRRGDLLKVEGDSQAKVVCAGLTIYDAAKGIGGVPCPAVPPILQVRGELAGATRGVRTASPLVVIAPRKTKLLMPYPLLRWTPLAGATQYAIELRGDSSSWKSSSSKTELRYPPDAPKLNDKESYKLIVSAGGHSSQEEDEPGLGFKLLPTRESKMVGEEEKRIRNLGLDDTAKRFLIAQLYASHGLNAEAIEQLEGWSNNLQEPAPMRLLAELYEAVGLTRFAEKSYLTALRLSEKASDKEGQVLTHQALGRVYNALGSKPSAIQHLSSTLKLLNELGDAQTAKKVTDHLAQLQRTSK